jgi:hypothetical protein
MNFIRGYQKLIIVGSGILVGGLLAQVSSGRDHVDHPEPRGWLTHRRRSCLTLTHPGLLLKRALLKLSEMAPHVIV